MGYSYAIGSNALCCDSCGRTGGVRKRSCTAYVLTDSLRSARQRLRYCKPAALCVECYRGEGGVKMHGRCHAEVMSVQAEYDRIEAALDTGESFVVAAFGKADWVPAGRTGLIFVGRTGRIKGTVPKSKYPAAGRRLSDYPNLEKL